MDLVEDHETEPIAQLLGAQIGRIVGRDGDRSHLLDASTELTDLGYTTRFGRVVRPAIDRRPPIAELRFELLAPLAQEIDRRDDDECWRP